VLYLYILLIVLMFFRLSIVSALVMCMLGHLFIDLNFLIRLKLFLLWFVARLILRFIFRLILRLILMLRLRFILRLIIGLRPGLRLLIILIYIFFSRLLFGVYILSDDMAGLVIFACLILTFKEIIELLGKGIVAWLHCKGIFYSILHQNHSFFA
jgi:hypothetical protein